MPALTASTSQLSEKAPLRELWWLLPEQPLLLLGGGTLVAAYLQSPTLYALYDTPKYIQFQHVVLILASIAVFTFGRWAGMATGRPGETATPGYDRVVRIWFYLSAALTIFGYSVWLTIGIKNGFRPATFWELLVTDDPSLSVSIRWDQFPTLPGITTCTEFGVPAALLGLWLYLRGHREVSMLLAAIVVTAALRSVAFSERTALIVLVVPIFVMGLRMCVLGKLVPKAWRVVLQLAPVICVVVLVCSFAAYESIRSWRWYREDFDSFTEFIAWRLPGYYTTAHNNGAMALRVGTPRPLPSYTLMPFWEFPLVEGSELSYAKVTGVDIVAEDDRMLEKYGTLALVNKGGMFQPALDYGLGGSLLFWFGYGFLAGRMYRGFLVGTLAGVTFYPVLYFTILQAPLELYLCFPRMLPAYATLIAVLLCVRYYKASGQLDYSFAS